jgi:hypothetical protein
MALGDLIHHSLDETTKTIATMLSRPNNLGIEFRPIRLRTRPETALLAVFVQGPADEKSVRIRLPEPLLQAVREQPDTGPVCPQDLDGILPAPRLRTVKDLTEAIRGILDGDTALFFHEAQAQFWCRQRAPVPAPPSAERKASRAKSSSAKTWPRTAPSYECGCEMRL